MTSPRLPDLQRPEILSLGYGLSFVGTSTKFFDTANQKFDVGVSMLTAVGAYVPFPDGDEVPPG